MKIILVTPSKSKGYSTLLVSLDKESKKYTVKDSFINDFGLCAGQSLSDEALLSVIKEDELYRARKKALNILAYGDNSKKALYDKLCRVGFSKDTARAVVIEMEELSYIDEDRILKRLILNEAQVNLYGKRRICAKLLNKGFPREKIIHTLSLLCESGEIDFDEIKGRLIEKKLGENADSEDVKALLYKYGY